MPGVFNLSVDQAVREAEEAASLGIGGLLLFGLPDTKDEKATGAWDDNGIVQQGLRAIKKSSAAQKLVLIADVCLCEYTSHGHCGVVIQTKDGGYDVDNDPSLDLLARTGASLARAGADIVAPSDMMDGRVAAIRRALDADGNSLTRPSSATHRSLRPPSMARSAKRQTPRRNSAIAAAIRWMAPICVKQCARSISISKKAPT